MAATQEKLYNELSTDVINDDDSAAKKLYEKYEKLPLVEQLALGFTPVVGETISAYETPIFARETKEAFQEGDYLKKIVLFLFFVLNYLQLHLTLKLL